MGSNGKLVRGILLAGVLALLGWASYRLFMPATISDPLASYMTGEMSRLTLQATPRKVSEHIVMREDGSPIKLSDMTGKVMLINLWASWCAPCRAEMHELAALQAELGDDMFEVVAVNVDRGGIPAAKDALAEWGVEGLAFYADPKMKTAIELANGALPTSFIIDRDGNVRAYFLGPLKWDAPEAVKLFEALKAGTV